VKCLFKNRKTRYRGLAKNNAQLFTLFGLANLLLARRFLGHSTPKLRLEYVQRRKNPQNPLISCHLALPLI
jgi:hypothetical protein